MEPESLLQFPCDFPLKIIGNGADFLELVIELVMRHAPDLNKSQVRTRESRTGRYQAVTVVINAQDRAQLDALYQELSAHPRITLVL